ncbi:MAG: HMA2 domain-containing protein, partial [Desulfovibrionaceae bacterium]
MQREHAIAIKHDMRGRLRLKVRALANGRAETAGLDGLGKLEGVLWLRVNPACASLVVGYDPEMLDRRDLLDEVEETFGLLATPGHKSQHADAACNASGDRTNSRPVRKAFLRFASISAVLGAAVVRESVFGLAVRQTMLSPLGLAGMFFSLPLITNGLKKLKEKRLTLDGFLAAGATAAITAGEAMTAFEILWINSGAEL